MSGGEATGQGGEESPSETNDSGDQWGIGEILEEGDISEKIVSNPAQALAEEIRSIAEDEPEVENVSGVEKVEGEAPAEFESWSENQFEEEPVDTPEVEASWMDDESGETVTFDAGTTWVTLARPGEGSILSSDEAIELID